MSAPEKTRAERLKELRDGKAKRIEAENERRELAEIARLELEEKLAAKHGTQGVHFALLDFTDIGEGLVALKPGPGVLWTSYANSKMEAPDADALIAGCLEHPSLDDFRALAMRKPGVVVTATNELAKLYGLKLKEEAGK